LSPHARILLLASLLAVGACATRGELADATQTAALPGTASVTAQAVAANVAVGKTTRAELIAALGKTTSIRFDSGYEVWVYQYRNDAANAPSELVVLLAPSGIVAKTRIRAAPPPASKQ
jgi:hypothetical protein